MTPTGFTRGGITIPTLEGEWFVPMPIDRSTVAQICELLSLPFGSVTRLEITPKLVEVDIVTEHGSPPMTVRLPVVES